MNIQRLLRLFSFELEKMAARLLLIFSLFIFGLMVVKSCSSRLITTVKFAQLFLRIHVSPGANLAIISFNNSEFIS
nr:MAG: hypothetical protein EDM05_02160 [Leptolyngbya sp. IPPAS B-1204]